MKFKLNNKKRKHTVKDSRDRGVWMRVCVSGCSGRKCFTAPSDRQTLIYSPFMHRAKGLRHDGRET